MGKKRNISDYMWWKEKKVEESKRSFPEELLEISKRVHTHIFGPIDRESVEPKVRTDILAGGNAYFETMHQYEIWEIDSKFNEFLIDFKDQLGLLCEKINPYIDDEQYRESALVHKLIDGMFKLNDEFYNLYNKLKQSEFSEKLPIRLRNALVNSSIDKVVDYHNYNNIFYYDETEEEKEIGEKYKEKIEQVKYLWVSIYRFLIQLVNKELDTLLANQNEESFKTGLKKSYIWEHIKWVEYGKNFPRSYSILQDKQKKLLNRLSQLEECFDEVWDLKKEAKIPDLDDIKDLDISKEDKSNYNIDQRKAKIARCLRLREKK